MCVHFPHWTLQRLRQARPDLRDRPLAITRPIAGKGSKVIACCPLACRHGVRPDRPAAEALAILPGLALVEEDADADREALRDLAPQMERYSPIVGLDEDAAAASLYADVTGCAGCFGGEAALLERVGADFGARGWRVQVALADTLGTAWAVAHFASSTLVPAGENASLLAALPVAALRLPAETVALLAKLGVERIEQLLPLPRFELASRFGTEVLTRLDQAQGRRAEVFEPYHALPAAAVDCAFEYPLEHWSALTTVCDGLLVRLEAVLEKRRQGARVLECVLDQEGAEPLRIECNLARPMRAARYLGRLLATHLEKLRAAGPIRGVCLRAAVTERIVADQRGLFERGPDAHREALAQLFDSLSARFGKDAICAARMVPDPQPERAWNTIPIVSAPLRHDWNRIPRPVRLYPRPMLVEMVALVPDGKPQRFHHAGVEHVIQRAQGPERIETGWWRGNDIRRDYFIVDAADGTRWWLFRRLDDGRWFLHGCFD
jgi:protein ImuB